MDQQIADKLIAWAERYDNPRYFEEDPIAFPRRFYNMMTTIQPVLGFEGGEWRPSLQDVEIAAVFAAHFAWGRRAMIVRDCSRLFDEMMWRPYDYVMAGDWRSDNTSIHRTVKWSEVAAICRRLRDFYSANDSLETLTAEQTRVRIFGQKEDPKAANKKIWMIALGIGLGFPFLVIVLREFLNTKVRGRKDIEKLSIPFVGELPQLEFPDEESTSYVKTVSEKIKNLKRNSSVNRKKRVKSKAHIVVKQGSRNIINEAFRVLRTNVEFMIGQNKDLKVIMTTSANPGSGKTFISYNLAKCMSLKGKKVCAIDLDLRRRSLSEYVGKPDQGVSDYINGAVSDWREVLVPGEGSDTFFILPAGTLPPNPAEIISYDRFTELINEIREEFDYVFFDCPPVEIVADTSILAKHADISLFVIRVGLMELDFLPIIEEYYDDQRFNNMGIILNGTLTANSRYGYRRYGYRYGYGYGYGYGGYGYYGSGYSEGYSSKDF